MRVKNLTLAELEKRVITIGFVDENLYTQVRIDCKELFDEHPDAIPSLAVQPPQGDAYPAVVTREGDIVVWNVAKSDVQYANLGRLQLTFVIGEIVAKSYVGKFVIDKSLMPDGEAPTPIENWITEANAVLGEIPGTIAEAVDDALEEAKESGEFDGADGVSPTVTVTKTKDGHNVVITDAEGDHSFDVPDGTEGKDGVTPQFGIGTVSEGHTADVTMTGTKENPVLNFVMPKVTTEDIVAVQDTQPTAEETAIWFPETPPTPVQVPTYAEHLELKEDMDSKVADVKYKNTSLVNQDGVAQIPPAQTSTPGLAMVGSGYGLKAADPNGNSAGRLSTDAATASHIKYFTDQYRPITPYYLPEAVFRGLAKVAGDNTQSSSQNPVGTYTDDAKEAIQEMLNVPDATENETAHAALLTEITNAQDDVRQKANVIVNRINGRIVTVDDAVQSNAVDVVCHINPVQAGIGDPSLSNIRAISGHTGLAFIKAGENLISDDVFAENFLRNADGGWDYAKTSYANVYGTKVYDHTGTDRLVVTYKCKYTNPAKTGLFLKIYYTNGTNESVLNGSTVTSSASKTVDYIAWTYSSNTSVVNTKDIVIQIEKYQTTTITTLTWQNEAGTLYGADVSIVNGRIVATDGYIASYNGETLPSTWISDRDVYEEGATPTIGAQVVYKLVEPIEYSIDPHQVGLTVGINNLWHSANGETELTYIADTKKYIDKKEETNFITMYITPEMFGAKGNGVTDDRTAIIDACEAAYKASKTVLFQSKMYYSSAPIVIEDVPDIEMIGTLIFNNSGNGLTLGKSSAATIEKHIKINISCDNQATGSGFFGFKILNAINCEIAIDSIKGFCYGFIIAGDTRGCAYNTVSINVINSIDKSLAMARTDENSFNSENLFIGGRFVQSGSDDVAIEVQGSNNVFIKPCMEYAAHSLVFNNANQNRVISCRTEHSEYAAKFVGHCDFNEVEVGYGSFAVDGFLHFNVVRYNDITGMDAVNSNFISAYNHYVFDAGFLSNRITIGETTSFDSPLWCISSGSQGELFRTGIDPIYFIKSGNEVEIHGGCMGVVVDCSITKDFAILQNGGGTGKVNIKLYDATGTQLDMSELSIGPFTSYEEYFGGVINYGNLPVSIVKFPSDAKSAFIGFSGIEGTSILTFAIKARTMSVVLPD